MKHLWGLSLTRVRNLIAKQALISIFGVYLVNSFGKSKLIATPDRAIGITD